MGKTAMSRILRRAAAVAATALVSAAVVVPPASADIAKFPDTSAFPDDGGKITSVRVSHGPTTIGVTANDRELTLATIHQFWLDTNPSDPGPEYRVEVFPDSDSLVLEKVTNFASPGIKVRCAGLDAIRRARTETGGYAKIIVSRRCMGTPAKVRVSVSSSYDNGAEDWAPGSYQFFPWVNR